MYKVDPVSLNVFSDCVHIPSKEQRTVQHISCHILEILICCNILEF